MTIEAKAATTGEWGDTRKPIVVAVDGSDRNRSAVAWAAHEAAALGGELALVNALPDYAIPTPHFSVQAEDPEILDMLARVRHGLHGLLPDQSVTTEAVAGDTVDVLLSRSASARLAVVGKRGLGGFTRAIVGSTSIALAGRSTVPVAIVPPEWDQPRHEGLPVVLGIDPTKPDREPIEAAFRRAGRLGVPLVAVHGWETPTMYSWDATAVAAAATEHEQDALGRFDRVVGSWREHYPDVVVRPMRVHQHPAAVILEAAQDAQVVVLGRHPAGFFGGFAFGSVARAVLHYAECPVIVVPAAESKLEG